MSESTIITRKSLKRKKEVLDGNYNLPETNEVTAQKNDCCSNGSLSYIKEEADEDIKILIKSNYTVSSESMEPVRQVATSKLNTNEPVKNEGFKIDTSKYEDEFHKHPFPPPMRTRSIRYTRFVPKKSHLTVEDSEKHLLFSGKALPQQGDIIKVKHYPLITVEEVKCFHRILSEAPSRKFKCIRNKDKLTKTVGPNGNRVSNRRRFLKEKRPNKPPKKIKASKKKAVEINNKPLPSTLEEFPSLVSLSPDINIDLSKPYAHGSNSKYIDPCRNKSPSSAVSRQSVLHLNDSLEDRQVISANSPCEGSNGNNQKQIISGNNQISSFDRTPLIDSTSLNTLYQVLTEDNVINEKHNLVQAPFSEPTLPSTSFNASKVRIKEFSLKPLCLVPPHLKSLVGSAFLKPDDVLLLILEWDVDWFTHERNHQKCPPVSYTLKTISSSYECFQDYYNTFFPLLMLEAWYRIYDCWPRLNNKASFSAEITSYSLKKDHVIVECKTVSNGDPDSVPGVGNIVVMNYSTKSNEDIVKFFGYIKYVNCYAESKSLTLKEDSDAVFSQTLSLIFMCVYDSDDINKELPVRVHILCPIIHYLNQSKALYFLGQSPLQKRILRPRNAEGVRRFSLSPHLSKDEISECVQNTIRRISLVHSVPVITLIETISESDHLKIIPSLIREIKNGCNKMKVLLYFKNPERINDIILEIGLLDLKLLITCKRCNVSPKFHKFLFDDLVTINEKQVLRKTEERKLQNKLKQKIKEMITQSSDVVLSRMSDDNNDFFVHTLLETQSIGKICCIMDEAHAYTEPETLIPTLYGCCKLILIGETKQKAKVQSKTAIEYSFDKSYFQRACEQDLSED